MSILATGHHLPNVGEFCRINAQVSICLQEIGSRVAVTVLSIRSTLNPHPKTQKKKTKALNR